jgi:hypothetical protein
MSFGHLEREGIYVFIGCDVVEGESPQMGHDVEGLKRALGSSVAFRNLESCGAKRQPLVLEIVRVGRSSQEGWGGILSAGGRGG